MADADALVIGAGPNGLVAANLLADAGWDVVVLEAQAEPGGAVRSGPLTLPGFTHDLFSAFYPLAAASPVMQGLDLAQEGLGWCRAPLVLAHPFPDGRCAVLSQELDVTASSLETFSPKDGDAWRRLYGRWEQVGHHLIDALFTPFPPVRAGLRVAGALGRDLGRFARFSMLSVRRLAEEEFAGEGGGMLLAGNTLHSDLMPESALGAMFGWLLTCLGQDVGFPVPQGGAGRLTDALVSRLRRRGGRVECGARVTRVVVELGRAVGVEMDGGRSLRAGRAVLADVGAPSLYLDLVGPHHLPPSVLDDISRFEYDPGTVKVDWALDGPIPWTAPDARKAGTVHVADGMDSLTEISSQLARKLVPARPFLLAGQMTLTDPSRSPAGTETAWAYTHVPTTVKGDAGGGGITGAWDERETQAFADRVQDRIEALAPGFSALVRARHVFTPPTMQAADANLVGGAINGGTAQVHQQLVFRPKLGMGRADTPLKGLFLASASAHPGGGVHGGPGANAARAAIMAHRVRRLMAVAGRGSLPSR